MLYQEVSLLLLSKLHTPWLTVEEYTAHYCSLLYISNHTQQYYHEKKIPKKSGGTRILQVPHYKLSQWQEVIKEQVLPAYPIHPCAFAYQKGLSVRDNALQHVGKNYVVKIDLKDFFYHISYGRVYSALQKSSHYSNAFVTLIANLCCVNGHLPQGACTSPMLSNICFYPVDEAIFAYCAQRRISYTRYCDDLTFSAQILHPYQLIQDMYRLLKGFGFFPNEEKTSVRHIGQKMEVTGITTNVRPRAGRAYRRQIRQDVFYIKKYGVREHLLRKNDSRFVINGKCQKKKYLVSLLGRVQYALFLDAEDKEMQQYCLWLKAVLNG